MSSIDRMGVHRPLKRVIRLSIRWTLSNPDVIKKTIRNINNLFEDPRLKGKLNVELVAFSVGAEVLMKTSGYEAAFSELASKGVLIVQCLSALKERKLEMILFFLTLLVLFPQLMVNL